jgi:hypothetical protein
MDDSPLSNIDENNEFMEEALEYEPSEDNEIYD